MSVFCKSVNFPVLFYFSSLFCVYIFIILSIILAQQWNSLLIVSKTNSLYVFYNYIKEFFNLLIWQLLVGVIVLGCVVSPLVYIIYRREQQPTATNSAVLYCPALFTICFHPLTKFLLSSRQKFLDYVLKNFVFDVL